MVKTITSSGHNFLFNKFTDTPPAPKPKKEVINHLAKERYNDQDFKKMLSIIECVSRDRSIKNKWVDDSENKYNQYINYFCSRADCILCKRAKVKRYLQNRIVKSRYFVTISTTITADQVEREKDFDIKESKYKQFRRDIRLFFDHLKIPFIGALEIGETGNLLHAHILTQKTPLSSVELSNLGKAFFGFVVNSKPITKGDGLKDYMTKIIPYISKITKDSELSKWNYSRILEPVHYILSNLYRATPITLDQITKSFPLGWWRDDIVKDDHGGLDFGVSKSNKSFQVFEKLMNQRLFDLALKNKDKRNPQRASLWVMGYFLRLQSGFLKDIENKIKKREWEKALEKQSLGGSVFRLSALPDPKIVELKIMEARRRILKGVIREYNRAIELSKKYNNICDRYETDTERGYVKVFSRYFISSPINKMLISNLSIESEINEKKRQDTGELLQFVTMKKMRTKKEVDQEKSLHFIAYRQNNLFLRLRKAQEKSAIDFSNKIWINSVIHPNPHLTKAQITQKKWVDSKGRKWDTSVIDYIEKAIDRQVNRQNSKKIDIEKFKESLRKKVDNIK